MGGKSISTSATRLEALSIQSSTYGATIPWVRGMQRLPGNLLWYGNFRSIPRTQKTGGKGGGGGTTTTYSYTASLMMALCHGVLTDIPRVWKGKGTSTMSALGLTRLSGGIGQATWSGLTGMGAQAIGYSGLAIVAGQNYNLGDSASVENHSFEVQHSSAYAVSGSIPDVDPSVALADLLTDASEGAALPAAVLGNWTQWSNWCVASGLLVSPLLTEQTAAIDVLRTAAELTNTGVVWSDGKLKMVPYADQAATGNGATFTPNNTPVYQLDDTCYTPADGQEPLRVSMKTPSDLFNHVRVEYRDRANAYQIAIAEAKDLTDISANGLRSMPTISAHWICTAQVARQVAEMRKQRSLLVTNVYEFELPWHYALLEPMDLITLSDSALGMTNVPARVTEISESEDGTLRVRAEDFPAGSANAPLYAAQAPSGFAGNTYADPGSVSKVVVFEAPGALTGRQLQIWVAARGDGAMWGGCRVWVSLDGTTYTALGEIQGGSRCGVLTGAIAGGNLPVQIGASQQLNTVSALDAAALSSLCYIGGTSPEFLAYTTAALTGAGAYTLGSLVRNAYGTSVSAHSAGDDFVFVDQSVAKSDAIDPSYVGKTVYIKVTSFNVFGVAEQSLASVSPISYTITGAMVGSSSNAVSMLLTTDSLALPASSAGVVSSYSGASTSAIVLLNGVDDTANWSFAGAASSGLTFSSAGPAFTVTALADATDAATLTITGTKAGNPALTKRLYVTKAKAGAVGGTGPTGPTGSTGSPGADATQAATVSLWQWSSSQPGDPNSSSTYSWLTAAHTSYTGTNGWSVSIPANPGTPGIKLWQAVKTITASATVSISSVSWASGFTVAAVSGNGNNGAAGLQSATPTVYQWSSSIPAGPSGAATYTWSTASFGAAPSGWSLTPGTSPSAGFTLWAASVQVQDSAANATTAFNWTSASITARGYAGLQGGTARYAYARIAGNPAPSTATVTTSGNSSFPGSTSWGLSASWAASDPNPSSTSTLYQTDGVYDPATGNTVWTTPYISSLKVGSLSAITANMGALNVDSVLTMGSAGMINQGAFTGFAWPTSGTGFHLGPQGLLMGNYNTGGFFNLDSTGTYVDFGKAGGPRFTWNATGAPTLTLTGATFTAGLIQTSPSGTRVVINESSENDVRFYEGGSLMARMGTDATANCYLKAGSSTSSRIGGFFESSTTAVAAYSYGSYGITATGTNFAGVYATGNGTGDGVYGRAAGSGSGVRGISTSGYAVYADGRLAANSSIDTLSGSTVVGQVYFNSGDYKIEATGSTVGFTIAVNGASRARFPTTGGFQVYAGFGCNGAAPQGPKVSGGTLAGVIAALVANGILSS